MDGYEKRFSLGGKKRIRKQDMYSKRELNQPDVISGLRQKTVFWPRNGKKGGNCCTRSRCPVGTGAPEYFTKRIKYDGRMGVRKSRA